MLATILSGLIVYTVTQLCVGIWWASKLTTRVDKLEQGFLEFSKMCVSLSSMTIDTALIKQKVEYIEQAVKDLNNKLTNHIEKEDNND